MNALVCRTLIKRYGDVVALNGLSLDVHRGECFGMLGPNGAGKTTTVEIFEGLREPDSGEDSEGPLFPSPLSDSDFSPSPSGFSLPDIFAFCTDKHSAL